MKKLNLNENQLFVEKQTKYFKIKNLLISEV